MGNEVPVMKPVDVLLCTALPEEAFLWNRWLLDNGVNKSSHLDGTVEVYGFPQAPALHVALTCFERVTNVGISGALSNALRAKAPRCVVMTGIAAGYYRPEGTPPTRYLNIGDVGFSEQVIYTSYLRVEDVTQNKRSFLTRLRSLFSFPNHESDTVSLKVNLRGSNIISASGKLVTIAKQLQVEFGSSWSSMGNTLFNTYKSAWENEYVKDQQPYGNPKAKPVRIASGESLIRSHSFQDQIVSHSLKEMHDVPVRMFEMEAFGLSTICQAAHMPFIVVKGISDYGGTDKGDLNHLAAISASTAFAISLILHPSFPSAIARPDLRLEHPSCLDPRVPICLYGEPALRLTKDRPCITFGFTGRDLEPHEAHVSRVYEGVEPREYSKALSTCFQELLHDKQLKTQEKATLFFPYSPKTLIDYIRENACSRKTAGLACSVSQALAEVQDKNARRDTSRRWVSWDDPLFPWEAIGEKERIITNLVELGLGARAEFPHFGTLLSRCNDLTHMGFSRLASKVARVIVCDFEIERIWLNPTYVIYPAFLGFSVPSYFSDTLARDRLFVEADVNFIETDFAAPVLLNGAKETGRVQALRFTSDTNTLIISAQPCNACGRQSGPNKVLQAIRNWREKAKPSTEMHDAFPRFPLVALAQKHLPADSMLLKELNGLQKINPDFYLSPPEPRCPS